MKEKPASPGRAALAEAGKPPRGPVPTLQQRAARAEAGKPPTCYQDPPWTDPSTYDWVGPAGFWESIRALFRRP